MLRLSFQANKPLAVGMTRRTRRKNPAIQSTPDIPNLLEQTELCLETALPMGAMGMKKAKPPPP
jgi:hypothetical protein